jgi:hypothetical protein
MGVGVDAGVLDGRLGVGVDAGVLQPLIVRQKTTKQTAVGIQLLRFMIHLRMDSVRRKALKVGTAEHEDLARRVALSGCLRTAAFVSFLAALTVAVVGVTILILR